MVTSMRVCMHVKVLICVSTAAFGGYPLGNGSFTVNQAKQNNEIKWADKVNTKSLHIS